MIHPSPLWTFLCLPYSTDIYFSDFAFVFVSFMTNTKITRKTQLGNRLGLFLVMSAKKIKSGQFQHIKSGVQSANLCCPIHILLPRQFYQQLYKDTINSWKSIHSFWYLCHLEVNRVCVLCTHRQHLSCFPVSHWSTISQFRIPHWRTPRLIPAGLCWSG